MIVDDILGFLNTEAELLELPTVMLDMMSDTNSIGLQTVSEPAVEKAYIDGSTIRRMTFRLTRKGKTNQSNSLANLEYIQQLNAFGTLFVLMEDFQMKVITSDAQLAVYRNALMVWMQKYIRFGFNPEEFPLGKSTVVVKAEVSTPSIYSRESNGVVTYGITINLTYKES